MSCHCASLGEIEKVENHVAFFKSLRVLENGNWVKHCINAQRVVSFGALMNGTKAIFHLREKRVANQIGKKPTLIPKTLYAQVTGRSGKCYLHVVWLSKAST